MNRYNGLLKQMARELGLETEPDETELDYKSRILYTALGAAAYASLQDRNDDADANSIVHFKRRVRDAIWSFIDLYPEMRSVFTNDWESLIGEIYEIFTETGQVYHNPNWLSPAAPCCAKVGDLIFLRGIYPDFACAFSGIGRYTQKDTDELTSISINEMFGLPTEPIPLQWKKLMENCQWSESVLEDGMEYHRLAPPFHYGFWTNSLKEKEGITVARAGLPGSRRYYLCRIEGKHRVFSQLPSWLTDQHGYRIVSTCCLYAHGTLPPIHYHVSGRLVYLHFSYLLPPSELNFLRLYSWPAGYAALPHHFHRTMDASVFDAFKGVLESIGYQFAKE